jgi:hypothetical protein
MQMELSVIIRLIRGLSGAIWSKMQKFGQKRALRDCPEAPCKRFCVPHYAVIPLEPRVISQFARDFHVSSLIPLLHQLKGNLHVLNRIFMAETGY